MTSFRKIVPAAVCSLALVGAAVPASAHGYHHGWGPGAAFAAGGLGLATGALIASHPAGYVERDYVEPVYAPTCAETVRTHYDSQGRLVKVITQNPC